MNFAGKVSTVTSKNKQKKKRCSCAFRSRWMFLFMLFVCGLSGCGRQKTVENTKIRVVTTIFPPYDFVRQIAGEQVELTMLLPLGAESHSYEPTPQDILAIEKCDIFIYGGGESDEWVRQVLNTVDTENKELISMMECVDTPLEEAETVGESHHTHSHAHSHDQGHENEDEHETQEDEVDVENLHEGYDEHVWTDPHNAMYIVEKIAAVLVENDEKNAAYYQEAAQTYLEELQELDAEIHQVVEAAPRKVLVFGDRFPMRYFTEAYGLSYYAAFSGCASDTEAGAATIASLIEKVRSEEIPAVIYMELSNGKIAETICEESGAKSYQMTSCHNLTKEQFDSGMNYIELMHQNIDVLRKALY